jgi:hypothetical protein
MKEKEIKFNQASRLTITEDAGERQITNIFSGRITTQKLVNRFVTEQEISLGSMKNPLNPQIKNIRWDVPDTRPRDFFTGWRR